MNYDFIKELKKFAENNDSMRENNKKSLEKYNKRKNGKVFSFSEHLQAIIYSLLSNQRKWEPIEKNKNKIDKIFLGYNAENIKNADPASLIELLKEIKCGNRNIKKQMNGLKDIISVLKDIEKEHGTMDNYFINHQLVKDGYPYYLAKQLADRKNKYKLKNMGVALICEYFKNIGIDIAKPDTHLKRMFGKNILGFSNKEEASPKEVIKYVKEIAEKNDITQIEADALLWEYCADGYGEICTKVKPMCGECVIKDYCNNDKGKR